MGRPLKISKAQAVLTITDTAETGSIVTISGGNLTTAPITGVASGMPFVVATTVGGLTANTTYYVDTILSNTTFSVSATDLSVQPRVMATLTDTTGESVLMSVGVVDAYFNNPLGGAGFPATNANTYGVVGGNTSIVGSQVLTRVAIGINGTGTLYSATDTAYVTGIGTDLANTLSVGSAIQVASANINGTTTDYTTLGFANTVPGLTTVAVANTQNTGNIIGTSGNAQTLLANGTVRFTANLGGLVAGQVYFVKAIANAAAFTVSTTLAGAEVDLSNATGTPDAQQDVVELVANAAVASTGAAFIYADDEAGYIVRQKGKTKYLVKGGTTGLIAPCYTANVANTALTPNTMNILSTDAASGTAYVSSVNDYNSEVFPAQVAAGSLSVGTVYTIYSTGTTDWSVCGAASNMTGVSFVAIAAGTGTGTAVLNTVNPDVIATFNTAYAANTYDGQPNPIVTIANA
jgi:hypothetical protein